MTPAETDVVTRGFECPLDGEMEECPGVDTGEWVLLPVRKLIPLQSYNQVLIPLQLEPLLQKNVMKVEECPTFGNLVTFNWNIVVPDTRIFFGDR